MPNRLPPTPPATAPLKENLRAEVMALVQKHGDIGAASLLGVGRGTPSRAGVGLPVRPSVAHTITAHLNAMRAVAAAAAATAAGPRAT